MALTIEELKAINLFIVGWGTEAARNPYDLVDIYHNVQINKTGKLGDRGNNWGKSKIKLDHRNIVTH
jgi:hypothetical protein